MVCLDTCPYIDGHLSFGSPAVYSKMEIVVGPKMARQRNNTSGPQRIAVLNVPNSAHMELKLLLRLGYLKT